MQKIDVSQFKLLLAAAAERYREDSARLLKAAISHDSQRMKNRRAVAKVVEPFLTKAGLDLDKLNKTLAHNQAELHRNFQKQKIEAAKHSASEINALRHAIELGNMAIEHLGNRPADVGLGLSTLIPLTAPFLIWEWPHPNPDQLKDSHIEPLNSFAKIYIDVPAYAFDNDEGYDSKEFSFYFLWENESSFLAVANVFSVLSLTGDCAAWANSGFFSGDKMTLSLEAWLYPISYWRPVPPNGTINDLRIKGDPAQSQIVLNLVAQGGSLFGDADFSQRIFSATPVGLRFGSFGGFSIPGRATALFEVSLKISWRWVGNALPDEIIADFADDKLNYSVGCPIVVLQLLTAPPAMA